MATPTLERRLAAVWFVDIVDFTRLSAADEPMAYRVMEAMRAAVRASLQANGGSLVKYLGDGALAHFPSAEAAVEAALQVHRRFRASTRLLPGPHALRVGVHLGEVAVGPDGDLFGDGVNRAARLQEMADPGQVLVSQAVRELLRQRPELVFAPLGKRTAKGIDEPIAIFEAQARGNLADRLEAVERTTAPVSPLPRNPQRPGARHPRAIATGIAAGLLAFLGLGLYTAWGGTPEGDRQAMVETAAPAPETALIPVADSLPGEGPLPRWPAMAPPAPADDVTVEPAPREAPPPPPRTALDELRDMARTANGRLGSVPAEDGGWHESLPVLRRGVDEALTGTPTGPRLDVLRGVILFLDRWDFGAAERAFQDALQADGGSTSTRQLYAQLLTALGRAQDAGFQLMEAERQGLDETTLRLQRGATLLRSGRPRDAERELRRVVDRRRTFLPARILLARALVERGDAGEARKVLSEGGPNVAASLWEAYAIIRDGGDRAQEARSAIPGLVRGVEGQPEADYMVATLMAGIGRDDLAFEHLDRAIASRDPSVVWLLTDPEWRSLREDARYLSRLHRVGLIS